MERLRRFLAQRPLTWALFFGAFAAFGQAPVSQPVISVLCFCVFLLLHINTSSVRRAFLTGWAFGTGYFATSLIWIVEPFLVDPVRHGWMAPFALLFMAAGLALFWAVAMAFSRWVNGDGLGAVLAWMFCLSAAELARSYVFSGFPWALIGHIWIGWSPMQFAALIGAQGLTLISLAFAVLIYGVFQGLRWAMIASVMAALVAAFVPSWLVKEPLTPPKNFTIRVVQPNAAQHLKWHPDHVLKFFERSLELTASKASTSVNLVIWPETSVPALLQNAGPAIERINAAAGGVPVVFGIQRRDKARIFNSLVSLSASGEIQAIYDKHHLVPFGEYIPGGNFAARFGIRAFAAQEGFGYSAGPGPALLDLGPLGRALPLICYEAVFAQDVNAAPDRPDFLLQITNDAWFGRWIGPYQHLAQARLRAVEQGVPLVRAANTGISGVINARGELVDSIPLNETGYLDFELPTARAPTFFSKTRDWPFLGLYLIVIIALFWRRFQNPIDADKIQH